MADVHTLPGAMPPAANIMPPVPVPRTDAGLELSAIDSPRFAQREDQEIWTAGWVCVGTSEALPNSGDILPYTVGNQGIHIARGDGGKFLGHFNKAPHGGCRFVPLQCRTGTKTKCTFTSCGYSRDRGVMNAADEVATHQYLGLRPERLLPVPVHVEGRLIFVNLGQRAPLSAPHLAHHPHLEHGVGQKEIWGEYGVNWKELPVCFFGNTSVDVQGDWLLGEIYHRGEHLELRWLFPNLMLLLAANGACVLLVQPTALRLTIARVTGFGARRDWHTVLRDLLCSDVSPEADAAHFLRNALVRRMGEDVTEGNGPHES